MITAKDIEAWRNVWRLQYSTHSTPPCPAEFQVAYEQLSQLCDLALKRLEPACEANPASELDLDRSCVERLQRHWYDGGRLSEEQTAALFRKALK